MILLMKKLEEIIMAGFLNHFHNKLNKFSYFFLITSWIIYFATGRGIVGGIFLCLSGLYAMVNVVDKKSIAKGTKGGTLH